MTSFWFCFSLWAKVQSKIRFLIVLSDNFPFLSRFSQSSRRPFDDSSLQISRNFEKIQGTKKSTVVTVGRIISGVQKTLFSQGSHKLNQLQLNRSNNEQERRLLILYEPSIVCTLLAMEWLVYPMCSSMHNKYQHRFLCV